MAQEIIVCLDPGVTTGYAILAKDETQTTWIVQATGTLGTLIEVYQLMHRAQPTLVLYERIQVMHKSIHLGGVETTGVIKLVCDQLCVPCFPRNPTHLATAARWPLKYTGITWDSIHAKEALLHAVVYLGPTSIEGIDVNLATLRKGSTE